MVQSEGAVSGGARERIQNEKSGLGAILAHAPALIVAVDGSLRVEQAGGRALRSLTPGPMEMRGRLASDVFRRRPELARMLEAAAAGEDLTSMIRVDERRFVARALPLEGAGGAVLVCLDATENYEMQRYGEPELRLLLKQVPASVWATDKDLRITHIAGQLAERFPAADVVGKTLYDLVETRDPTHPLIAHHLEALAGAPNHFRFEGKGREFFDVHIEPRRSTSGEIVGCLAVAVSATDTVRREEELTESRARLEEAQRVAHVGCWTWDLIHDRVDGSDETYRIFGVEPGTNFGSFKEVLERFFLPEDRPHVENVFSNIIRTAGPYRTDYRIIRPDGEVRRLHARGQLVSDAHGRPLRLVGCTIDVTERWNAEQERERSLSLLRATLESTADGLLVVDRKGTITAFNQRFAEMWRIPPRVLESYEDAAALAIADDQLQDPEGFRTRVRDLYDQPEIESYDAVAFKDGRVFERYSRPQRLGGEIVGRVWSFRDVTVREQLLKRVLLLADASRLLASLDVEPAMEAVAHLAIPFLGESCALDLFAAEGGPRRLFAVSTERVPPVLPVLPRAALAGHPLTFEDQGRSCIAAPLVARETLIGALSFVAAVDRRYGPDDLELCEELARRMSLAYDNAQLFRRAQEALDARDEFICIAAHELRGPATSLRLAIQSLREGRLSPATSPKVLEVCDRQVKQMTNFVEELLDVSRLRSGAVHLDLEQVDLAEVMRDMASRMSADLSRSGSSLSIAGDARLVGTWDRFKLEQVVGNLLSNAIKFGAGKPIEIIDHAEGSRAILTVRDHGMGIPVDRQAAIFQPFERAVSSRHYGGLGLGLYICRRIVDAFGGEIHLESAPGQGSTFRVELPTQRSEQ
jgi:PAS domain S-box-containing protein